MANYVKYICDCMSLFTVTASVKLLRLLSASPSLKNKIIYAVAMIRIGLFLAYGYFRGCG